MYRKWRNLSRKEATATALPIHQPWDHEIKLRSGTQSTFGPIYALSDKELETLRKYLDENYKKGFIRKAQSPAGYPILEHSIYVSIIEGSTILRLRIDTHYLTLANFKTA